MAYNNFNFDSPGYVPSYDFNFGAKTFRILAGTSKDFTSIWAEPNASIESATMYVASAGSGAAFSVINLAEYSLKDSYTLIEEGLREEPLEREDIVDINVG